MGASGGRVRSARGSSAGHSHAVSERAAFDASGEHDDAEPGALDLAEHVAQPDPVGTREHRAGTRVPEASAVGVGRARPLGVNRHLKLGRPGRDPRVLILGSAAQIPDR